MPHTFTPLMRLLGLKLYSWSWMWRKHPLIFFFFFPLIKLRKENATMQSIDHILPIKTYVARFFNEKNIYSLSYVRFINRP
jgi:hypothetical protein